MLNRHRPSRCAGFSLIEVLITVVVVAIGLLSVAGLQAISKKANFDAIQRNTAAALAQEIIERMRANASQATQYLAPAPTGLDLTSLSMPSPNCAPLTTPAGPACTPAQMVPWDLWIWGQDVLGASESVAASGSTAAQQNLGGLSAPTICISQVQACTFLVAIAWRGLTPVVTTTGASVANDPANNACGASNAAYVAPSPPAGSTLSSGTTVTMRRILVVQAAIRDPDSTVQPCP